MIRKIALFTALAVGLMSVPAKAQSVELGVLTCDIDGGFGAIFGSNRQASCVFLDKNGAVTTYTADITKIGPDLGFVASKTLTWAVLAASNNVPRNLRGTYVGANVEASAFIGAGGNVMVGGMRDSFALNPVSIQTQTGINAALAVQVLRIR